MGKLVKKPEEIALIAEGGAILGRILKETASLVRPGVSTLELNEYAETEIRKAGGTPSFLGYGPKHNRFPAALCTSINDVVVHGVPSKYDMLNEGDIVGLDIGMEYEGFFTDTAVTVPAGAVRKNVQRLIDTTRHSLEAALAEAKPGNRTGDVGFATQQAAEREGFSVIRDLVGHGVGYEVHEDPNVPNYGKRGTGTLLEAGMVLAISTLR